MARHLKFLIAEDNPLDGELLLRELSRAGYEPEWRRVWTEPDFARELAWKPDLILADFHMPRFTGLRALELVKEQGLDIPFIVVSGTIGEETAAEVMRKGATDYLLKDRLTRLGPAIAHALENVRTERERTRALRAVALAEAKYRSLFDNSVQGIYQTTEDGKLLIANLALARIAGYATAAELIASATNLLEHVYAIPGDRKQFLELMRSSESVRRFETQMRRRDGSLIWISATGWRIRDAGGSVLYEGTVEDITDRKQAEAALRTSEQRFRTTLEKLMEGCQIISRDWRYIYVNEMAAHHGRRTVEQLVGRLMADVYPELRQHPAFDAMEACMKDGVPRQIESEFAYDDGTSAFFQLLIQPVPEGLFVLSLDITARRQAEHEIRAQLSELQRWHALTLGREERVMALKNEVNELLARASLPARYVGGDS